MKQKSKINRNSRLRTQNLVAGQIVAQSSIDQAALEDAIEEQSFYDIVSRLAAQAALRDLDRLILGIDPANPNSDTTAARDIQFLNHVEDSEGGIFPQVYARPIPEELEESIRQKPREDWLPWEEEAILKVDLWKREQKVKKDPAASACGKPKVRFMRL